VPWTSRKNLRQKMYLFKAEDLYKMSVLTSK
jgi:hypothetical protein